MPEKAFSVCIKDSVFIDPPYNTGNDFVYRDSFKRTQGEENKQMGMYDEDENRLFRNTDSNGRFHSDWCSMIYPRLMLARNLLSDDGVIFISIDDNEVDNLKKICNEVFGESNFIGLMTLLCNPRGSQNGKFLSNVHEHILMYAKNAITLVLNGIPKKDEDLAEFNLIDENGRRYRYLGLRKRGGAWRKEDRPNMHYPIYVNPNNGKCSIEYSKEFSIEVIPKRPSGELSRWTWGKDKFLKENNLLVGRRVNRAGEIDFWDIFRKDYIDDEHGEEKKTKLRTIWTEKETNYQNAKNEIRLLFGNSEIFDYPKPTYIIKTLASILYIEKGDIVLDFFSGSATTAHAVMQLNEEDGGHRKFIMVQLPEPCDEKSEAYKAGYKNICEIGKERIRRAGDRIKSESPMTAQDLDIGFRVFRLDDTNMKDVYYAPQQYRQKDLLDMISNIKEDRSDLDLLFGCLLEWGLPLSMPYTSEQLEGCTVHTYNDGDLIACFDENIPDKVIRTIAKRQPLRAVFRDSSFDGSPAKINVGEIFKMLAPDTRVKVI